MAFLSSFYPQPVVKGTTAGTFAEGNDPRLSDARTPLSHSSTHHTGGTDAIAPSSIGAQTLFTSTTLNLTANTTLTAARATNYSVINTGNYTITLPTTGHLVGDIVVVRYVSGTGTLSVTWGAGGQSIALNAQYRFIATGTGATNWALVNVDTHTHGNISNTGTIGSTAGLPVVTTTSGAISTLALGTANQVLRVNSEATGVEFGAAAGGGTKTYAVFTAQHNQPPSTAFATLDTRNSIAVLDFDDTTDESAVFVSIIPEGASLGSGLKIRLHWMATTATSGDVVWDVSLERMTTDLDSDSFDTIASGTAAANGTSGILTVTEITLTTIDSVTAGDGFRLKVTRDANNASDTMTGDAELVVCEVRSAA